MSATPPPHLPRHRIVVVGHGMVAARFLDELDRRVPPGFCEVTVLGAEPHAPYNRLLLSEVVAGRADLHGLTLPDAPRDVRVLAGVSARRIRRGERVVEDDRGGRHGYDTLVLATGAQPRVPSLPGLTGPTGPTDRADPADLPRGVHALRTLDDCREILAAAGGTRPDGSPRRATVLGGGVLGLEAARGLAARGLAVTIVHSGAHPMDRQLDAASGAVLRRCLSDRRIRIATRARAQEVTVSDGAVSGVRLGGGRHVETDLLVLTAGVIPRTDLAEYAGLDVDRGVVVGADLRTPADPRIAAIGDCARTPDGWSGLLAPGWEQAGALARDLAAALGGEPTVGPGGPSSGRRVGAAATDVVRLKAEGLDVVAFGAVPDDWGPDDDETDAAGPTGAGAAAEDVGASVESAGSGGSGGSGASAAVSAAPRVVTLLDVQGRRSLRLAVRDGRLVGGVLVGAGALAADLLVAYERGTAIPLDPARLLLKGGGGGVPVATSPASIPGSATICRCNGVTKSAIVTAFEHGERTLAGVAGRTRATTGCGGCTSAVEGILEWLEAADPAPPPGAREETPAALTPAPSGA
ncbi:FAD-dependent oxidoreductase [Agilicoccus flavus]|uniref:FAD-dependent oxidoreductase n=1 Tax=Agilicoccus flavus TaxID=2775968 RepID=UPI001CF6C134|nr:FAD-dependent oxidoreductase [Agilicoccus flavus]